MSIFVVLLLTCITVASASWGPEEKWMYVTHAVALHCNGIGEASTAACDLFMNNCYLVSRLSKLRDDLIFLWQLVSANESASADPWAPLLVRAIDIVAPRLLELPAFKDVRRWNSLADSVLDWTTKWDRFIGMVRLYCASPAQICDEWYVSCEPLVRGRAYREVLLGLWASFAIAQDWAFDPWKVDRSTAANFLRLYRHPEFANMVGRTWFRCRSVERLL